MFSFFHKVYRKAVFCSKKVAKGAAQMSERVHRVLVIVLIAAVWFSYRAGPEKGFTENDGNTLVEEDF